MSVNDDKRESYKVSQILSDIGKQPLQLVGRSIGNKYQFASSKIKMPKEVFEP